MKAIGNKPLEAIKLRQALVLTLFASLLLPQNNLDHITHPLSHGYNSSIDSTESYLLLEAINHVDIEDMIYTFNNSLSYKTIINGYGLNVSYLNSQSMVKFERKTSDQTYL